MARTISKVSVARSTEVLVKLVVDSDDIEDKLLLCKADLSKKDSSAEPETSVFASVLNSSKLLSIFLFDNCSIGLLLVCRRKDFNLKFFKKFSDWSSGSSEFKENCSFHVFSPTF